MCYNFVLQKAILTHQWRQGTSTNFFSQLRSIMKVSINIYNRWQGLGQCLKQFLNPLDYVCFLQRQAGDGGEKHTEASSSFVLTEHPNGCKQVEAFMAPHHKNFFFGWIAAFSKEPGKALEENNAGCSIFLTGQKQLFRNYSKERVVWYCR